MIGRNPLLVAKEHGHRPTTMLSVYAAWRDGSVEADIAAIREAMSCADEGGARHKTPGDRPEIETPTSAMTGLDASRPDRRSRTRRSELVRGDFPIERRFGSRFGSSLPTRNRKPLENNENIGGKGGTRTLDPGSPPEPNPGSTFDRNSLILLTISFNRLKAIGRCIPK